LDIEDKFVLNKDEERKILEAELKEIKAEREEIEKRLKDLK
jgi:cell division protein FtsB